jgi:hypothetical protein
MTTTTASTDRLRTAIRGVALCGAAMSVVALPAFGLRPSLGVALGAAIATANLWALARILPALLPTSREGALAQSRAAWGLLAALKTLGLFAVLWLVLRSGVVPPLAMLAGYGSLPIGIAIGSLVSDRTGAA